MTRLITRKERCSSLAVAAGAARNCIIIIIIISVCVLLRNSTSPILIYPMCCPQQASQPAPPIAIALDGAMYVCAHEVRSPAEIDPKLNTR